MAMPKPDKGSNFSCDCRGHRIARSFSPEPAAFQVPLRVTHEAKTTPGLTYISGDLLYEMLDDRIAPSRPLRVVSTIRRAISVETGIEEPRRGSAGRGRDRIRL